MDKVKRSGDWLPASTGKQIEWVNSLIRQVSREKNMKLNDAADIQADNSLIWEFHNEEVRELSDLIHGDSKLHQLATQMVDQALEYAQNDPTGAPELKSYSMMLHMIDKIIETAPKYMAPGEEGRGLIGFPINAILDWCMGTPAGISFFLEERINRAMERILKKWCEYLISEKSVYVLNADVDGWLCETALKELNMDQFVCDVNDKHYGFSSWNDFFTRQFREGMRPVAAPEDDYVITAACESAPYRISRNVEKDTKFWLKGQPYALRYMLDDNITAQKFEGGTVYQAFLSATKYHRWHSPISGTVKEVKNIPGTYYSEISSYPYDDAGPNNSQGYITHVAARAVILLESDNSDVGLVGFIAVGMAEVSSCVITVKEGQKLKKGDELGYFQFGGSTHCLLFQRDVIEQFVVEAIPAEDFNDSAIIQVKSKLATVRKREGST